MCVGRASCVRDDAGFVFAVGRWGYEGMESRILVFGILEGGGWLGELRGGRSGVVGREFVVRPFLFAITAGIVELKRRLMMMPGVGYFLQRYFGLYFDALFFRVRGNLCRTGWDSRPCSVGRAAAGGIAPPNTRVLKRRKCARGLPVQCASCWRAVLFVYLQQQSRRGHKSIAKRTREPSRTPTLNELH